MITEIRMIGFSTEALTEAVRLFGEANPNHHFSQVRYVQVCPGMPPRLTAEVCGDDSDATDSVEFTAAETAALLILLCRRNHIPLPHHAEKSLRMVGTELCLIITRRALVASPGVGDGASDLESAANFESPDGA